MSIKKDIISDENNITYIKIKAHDLSHLLLVICIFTY